MREIGKKKYECHVWNRVPTASNVSGSPEVTSYICDSTAICNTGNGIPMTTATQNKEIAEACSDPSFRYHVNCLILLGVAASVVSKTPTISVLVLMTTFQGPYARIIIRSVRVLPKHGEVVFGL
jgi:hypothetical protein